MMKFVIAVAAMFAVASPALAQIAPAATSVPAESRSNIDCNKIDITKYTPDELSRVQALCNTTVAAAAAAEKVTPEDVREWASLGKEFSDAVIETAKGLGVTANEFLTTPVGLLLALYFMWDIIGGILVGVPLLVAIWWLYFKVVSIHVYREAEYAYVPVLFGLFTRKKIIKHNISNPSDAMIAMILTAIPAVILSIMDIGMLIF
jgi:hypothetical protein